jgi:phosphoglycerate dehydrogenase-like enzyme
MLTVVAPSDLQLSDSQIDVDLASVGFYVPPYMGLPSSLEVIAQMPNLEVIQILTVGFDSVLKYLPGHVRLCNAVGVHDASAAELAVALTLASLRGIDDFARAMPEGKWLHERRDSLVDRSVVIVGAGGVGQGIANRMVPFEVDVTLVARSQRPGVLSTTELPRLLPLADIVILAVPLTTHTADLVDDAFLSQMRDGALLVNMARGGVVNTDALVRHAQQGRIRAALDANSWSVDQPARWWRYFRIPATSQATGGKPNQPLEKRGPACACGAAKELSCREFNSRCTRFIQRNFFIC